MDQELASQLTIAVSTTLMGVNLLLMRQPFEQVAEQVASLREQVVEENIDPNAVLWYGGFLHLGLPLFFLALLVEAGFHGWVIAMVGAKFAVGGGIALWLQHAIARGRRDYTRGWHRYSRLDYGANALLGGTLAALFFL